MKVRRLTGSFGAVLEGLDLEVLDDSSFEELHDALMAHQVVFVRGQALSEAGHRALAQRFGTPSVYPLAEYLGETEYLHHIEDTAESPPDADGWHMDITWMPSPPIVAILCGIVIPGRGGDTLWANLYGAWEGLSPTLQAMLAPLQVRHTPGETFWKTIARHLPDRLDELQKAFPGAVHPLVRAHPVTGRTLLNLGGYFMDSIEGLEPEESSWLLGWLKARVEDPNLQLRWSWQEGDVAIWDERSTLHRALSDHYPEHRKMRRCTINA